MTELLVKTFVKNYENTEEAKVRTAYGVLASLVGIVCNLLLFAGKLTVPAVIAVKSAGAVAVPVALVRVKLTPDCTGLLKVTVNAIGLTPSD